MARYIEEENLIEEIMSLRISVGGKDVFPDVAKESVLRIIKEQSTAEVVEVKHGEWIAVPSSDMSTGKAYKCSECGKFRYGCRLPPYCQECGAKMDGGKMK